jgi:flagellar hook-associated protein FlgK
MSDILGISSNAVSAYQMALSTVSNNIANVNTEGYSRQDVVLQDTAPTKSANTYFGTGVALQQVKRQFDAFAESNLRNSASDLNAQQPMVDYTSRVMNVMGDSSLGLSSALDDFFSSANSLSADPASTVLRTTYLQTSNEVSSRFSELSGQLTSIGSEVGQGLDSAVSQVNALTTQLSLINQNMTKSPTLDGQPAQLLDQRDLVLQKLSALVKIKTSYTSNGTVSVSLSDTMSSGVVVNGQKAIPIGVDRSVVGKTALILDPYGKTESLASASGGQIGGYLTFNTQVLDPAMKSLDALAQTFVKEANNVQTNGIDGYGSTGQPLFSIDPNATNPSAAISVALSDPMRVSTASQFRVTENNSNTSGAHATVSYQSLGTPVPVSNTSLVNNPNPTAGVTVKVDGAAVYSPVTTLAAGVQASFYLDNPAPGQQLQVLTRDGRQLLGEPLTQTQQYQMLTTANGFSANSTYSSAYLNQSGQNGYRGMDVFYGAKASVQYAQAFDANGVAMPSIPQTAVLDSARIPASNAATQIAQGAIVLNGVPLSALTPSGTSAVGLTPTDIANWINDPATIAKTGVHADVFSQVNVPANQVDYTKSLSINGQVVLDPTASSGQQGSGVTDLKSLVNSVNSNSTLISDHISASLDKSGNLVISNDQGQPITINPGTVADGGVNALGITPSTYTGQVQLTKVVRDLHIPSTNIDYTKPLQINGVSIDASGASNVAQLAGIINGNNPSPGVTASVGQYGELVLSTPVDTDPNGQAPISIGPPQNSDGTTPANALGLAPMDYTATERLKEQLATDPTAADSDIRLSFGTYGDPPQTGTPADLAKIGFRTGAYIQGGSADDLMVFVTGQGKSSVAASYSGKPTNLQDSLRQQSLVVKFTDTTHYTITDAKTGTELANRTYDPSVLQPTISFEGMQIQLNQKPSVGDSYQIDGNQDGLGNNQNILNMADLAKKPVINGSTISDNYINQINNVGNLAQQAKITQQALQVVNDQAVAAKDKVSGVNLDDEAAALIRYQQAYQAAAKALQVSGQLFDSIVKI